MRRTQVIRDALGAIEDELRQRRAVDTEILKRLDILIRMASGSEARLVALREDHEAHVSKVASLERSLRAAGSLPR